MSFRMFVYYCAVLGGWSGFVGWLLGWGLAPRVPPSNVDYFPSVLHDTITALFLGFAVALALSFLDATFNLTLRKFGKVLLTVFAAAAIGVFGGMCAGFIGGSAFFQTNWNSVFLVSWIILGLLVGMSISFFQLVGSLVSQKDFGHAMKKFIKCLVGGTIGGVLGGIIALILTSIGHFLWPGKTVYSPTAIGFVAIGACIGLLVGLAQVILKEAWIKVEAGFRPGREMLLQKETTSIGRAENADIALFGDMGIEKAHAHIVKDGGRYYLVDLQSPGGSFVNDQKVEGRAPLKGGDLIRVGKSALRFNERAKRKD